MSPRPRSVVTPLRRPLRRLLAVALMALVWGPAVARGDESPLRIRSAPTLTYPAGQTGDVTVVVGLTIDRTGNVKAAAVVRRIPDSAASAFDAAALQAAQAIVFEPVVIDGQAVEVSTELSLRFTPPEPPTTPLSAAITAKKEEPATETVAPSVTPDKDVSAPAGDNAITPPAPHMVRVRGRRADATVGEVHLHGALLQETGRRSAEEMLASAPGILMTNHGGEGHAPAVFLRGFDAGEGQDLEFRLDGVPLNEPSNPHSHGYADTHFIIPELVDELRVVEGPFDPRQGDFAVAGTAEYHLGLHDRGLRLQGTYGSFNTQRVLALWGPEGMEDGTFVGVDLRQSDGFGTNRASSSASAMAQYEARLSDTTRLTVLGQSYAARFDSAGVLRNDDYLARRLPCAGDADSQFFCTYDANQGGASTRHGLSARLTQKIPGALLEQQIFASTRHLRLRENYTGFLYDITPAGETQRGDGSEKLYDSQTIGLRGALRLRRTAWERPQELELGYTTRYDQADGLSRRLRAVGGEAYRRDLDYGVGVTDIAFYMAGQLRPTARLSIRGGLRLESFGYNLWDRNRPVRDRDGVREPSDARDAFGWTLMPRLTVQYNLAPGLEWLTSAGTGARSSDAAALSDGEFAPFHRVHALESGLLHEARGTGQAWNISTRVSAFATRVDQALIFDEVLARNALAGASNRYGALLLSRLGLGPWLDAQASLTYAEAYRPPEGASLWPLWAGERMPYVPRWVGRFDGALRREATLAGESLPWSVGMGVTWVAPRPLPLGAFSDPIFTVDATVRGRWRWAELSVTAQNLLDARYRLAEYNYASNFAGADLPASLRASRTFSAGPPRMVLASLAVRFDALSPLVGDHDHHEEDMK